jgi:L-lactate dehydrogenase complex protein LldF
VNLPAQQFKRDAQRMTKDLRHRSLIQTALKKYEVARDARKARFQDWQSARQTAAEIKWDAINHLDKYLTELVDKLEARGTKVHWATTGEQARQIILGIVREKKARSVIKSKVMTGEEIHLNEALEKAGLAVVESDFGEYIVQLRHEAPYHFVFPAMHLLRGEISDLFERELGSKPTDSPEELMIIARRVLRGKYLTADVGISGANFAIAETGMISITENEGNARLTCAFPSTHIALMGIEKVLPKMEDLALSFRCSPPPARDKPSQATILFMEVRASQESPTGRRNSIWCSLITRERICWRTPSSATRFIAYVAVPV